MNLHLRNTVSQFILVAYILAGVLLEVGHHDIHDITHDAAPAVSSHECGAHEIYVPLDKRHECLACTQSTQLVSTEASQYVGLHALVICFAAIPAFREQPLETDFLYSGKRGPPYA